VWRRRPSPDPGAGVTVELSGGDAGGVGDILGVGHRDPGEGCAAEEPPPPFDEVEPGGADRNEGVLDPRVGREPLPDRSTQVASQMVGDQEEIAARLGGVDGVQQRKIARGVACGGGLGQHLPVAHRQRPVPPHFVRSPLIVERHFDAVPIR
jgi:hypothetical protein